MASCSLHVWLCSALCVQSSVPKAQARLTLRTNCFLQPTLIVEQNPRLGDSWRNRYHSLALHDPVWADHFPYIPYPRECSFHLRA